MSRVNNSLKLAEIREGLPGLAESAQCAQRLRAAMFDGVTEADVGEIMRSFVAKAKTGDAKAAKLVFDVIAQAGPRTTLSIGVRANQAGHAPPPSQLPPHPLAADDAEDDEDDDESAPGPVKGLQLRGVRIKVAQALGRVGPMTTEEIAAEAMVNAVHVGQAIEGCEWFRNLGDGRWKLSEIGRKEACLDRRI